MKKPHVVQVVAVGDRDREQVSVTAFHYCMLPTSHVNKDVTAFFFLSSVMQMDMMGME